jgi:hypothetical protein
VLEIFSRNDSQRLISGEKYKDALSLDADFVIVEFKEFALL